jgi:hypothetical protein
VPFVFAGIVIQWRRREPVLVLALWAALATFTAASAFGNVRYRTAAEITITIFAAIAFDAIWSAVSRWRSRAAGGEVPDGSPAPADAVAGAGASPA